MIRGSTGSSISTYEINKLIRLNFRLMENYTAKLWLVLLVLFENDLAYRQREIIGEISRR